MEILLQNCVKAKDYIPEYSIAESGLRVKEGNSTVKIWHISAESVSLQDVGRRFTVGVKKREMVSALE